MIVGDYESLQDMETVLIVTAFESYRTRAIFYTTFKGRALLQPMMLGSLLFISCEVMDIASVS